MSSDPIGFVGLGLMGQPMAANVLRAGYRLRVYNRTAARAEPLVARGAEVVDRVEHVVEPGGLVLSCLADDAALESVLGVPAFFEALGPDGVHVSMSTIAPETAAWFAERHEAAGSRYVAAPIMGRPDAVAEARQFYLVSGPEPAVARAQPILKAVGSRLFRFGDSPTAAHVAKLSTNFLIASTIEAIGEAYALCEKHGVDVESFYQMFSETLFNNPIHTNYGRQIADRTYRDPLFRLRLGRKDVRLVQAAAASVELPMPMASVLVDRYTQAVAAGLGEYDWTGVTEVIRRDAGLSYPD